MAYDREADTPGKTLERLRTLVMDHLKPDSGVSEHEAYMRVIDTLDVEIEEADAEGRPVHGRRR